MWQRPAVMWSRSCRVLGFSGHVAHASTETAALPRTGARKAIKLAATLVAAGAVGIWLLPLVWGLRFENPIGLAAGFDKQAEAIAPLLEAGFGFVEVGTVTPLPQPGNPRPRMFRLPEDRAVINRFGFNSDGAVAVADRLARFSADRLVAVSDPVSGPASATRGVLGVNIGKNKAGEAEEDYEAGIGLLSPFADYVTVNISSPNTPGLRQLQSADELRRLLRSVIAKRDRVFGPAAAPLRAAPHAAGGGESGAAAAHGAAPAPTAAAAGSLDGRVDKNRALDEALASARRRSLSPGAAALVTEVHHEGELVLSAMATFMHRQLASDPTGLRRAGAPPLLVKIAPDLTDEDVAAIVAVALELGVDGLIVSNTTVARPATLRSAHATESGGLSGVPLMQPSTVMLRKVYAASGGRLPIIGVGGVSSAEDAYVKIRSGASLVQVYSALVYEGPTLVCEIKKGLVELLRRDGFSSVSEAVGADVPVPSAAADADSTQ